MKIKKIRVTSCFSIRLFAIYMLMFYDREDNYETGGTQAGKTTKNVLPCPSADSTQMRP